MRSNVPAYYQSERKKEKPIQLLDCTLRDGGYINNWEWGFEQAQAIVKLLTRAGVDVVEVGFLRDVESYSPDVTACRRVEELNRLLPNVCGETSFSAMAMHGGYDASQLSPYSGEGIDIIRVTAHDYDIEDGIAMAAKVQEKGYRVSINPINIMGYSDARILEIVEMVNHVLPYQFSIVDTFGSMKRRDLDRITSLIDHNLDSSVRLALHLHENMSLSCSLAQRFLDKGFMRPIAIDGSLMGMGRMPGNLPLELIADYMNDCGGQSYDIDCMMDAIQDYIVPIRERESWGYKPEYFLSARFNLHRNYAEFLIEKGDLTTRDINQILSRFDPSKAAVFDKDYANRMYEEYRGVKLDDTEDRFRLKEDLAGREVVVLAPGATLRTQKSAVDSFLSGRNCAVVALNFYDERFPIDFVFFGNNRRRDRNNAIGCSVIATSNVEGHADYRIDYNSVSGSFAQGCNSLFLVLKLLKSLGIERVALAGADGYVSEGDNYYNGALRSSGNRGAAFNRDVAAALKNLRMDIQYVTPSMYDI